jgi:hypothetical protein
MSMNGQVAGDSLVESVSAIGFLPAHLKVVG